MVSRCGSPLTCGGKGMLSVLCPQTLGSMQMRSVMCMEAHGRAPCAWVGCRPHAGSHAAFLVKTPLSQADRCVPLSAPHQTMAELLWSKGFFITHRTKFARILTAPFLHAVCVCVDLRGCVRTCACLLGRRLHHILPGEPT